MIKVLKRKSSIKSYFLNVCRESSFVEFCNDFGRMYIVKYHAAGHWFTLDDVMNLRKITAVFYLIKIFINLLYKDYYIINTDLQYV